jgi:hypothetical protein
MLFRRFVGDPVQFGLAGLNLFDVPLGFALAALGVYLITVVQSGYSLGLEIENRWLHAQNKQLRADLATAETNLRGAQSEAKELKDRTLLLQIQLAGEVRKRKEAEQLANLAWSAEKDGALSSAQKEQLNALNTEVERLNSGLTALGIRASYWPRFSENNAVATYEIYRRDDEDEALTPRGAGLILFATEQYDYGLSEKLKSGLAKLICDAATSAVKKNIAPISTGVQHPEFGKYEGNEDIVQVLTDFVFLMMKIKLLSANSLVVVRGYADAPQASWTHPLDQARTKMSLYEVDGGSADYTGDALDFRPKTSMVKVGRPETNYSQYGNEDLPNLRAGATAELISTLLDACPVPAGLGAAGEISVEPLQGLVYPDKDKDDQKARVHLLIYLKNS